MDGELVIMVIWVKFSMYIVLFELDLMFLKVFFFLIFVFYEDDFLVVVYKFFGLLVSGNYYCMFVNVLVG